MSDAQRLADLESRVAFQEDTLDKLNDIVARQDIEIQRLTGLVRILSGQLKELDPGTADELPPDAPPPHY